MKKVTKTIMFSIIFFILIFAIVVQLRTIKNSDVIWLSSYKTDDLIDELFKWKNKYETAMQKVEKQEETLKEYKADNRERTRHIK